jgi:Recombinase/Recombinase zinc beta ribbon domain
MPGGVPRYGWRWKDETKERYVIVDHEAEVFHRIYHELADEGKTIYQICEDLEAEGEPSPSMASAAKTGVNSGNRQISNRWHEASLAHMLREPCYWGEAVYNRKQKYVKLERDPKTNHIVEKHLQRNRSLDDGEVIHYPPEVWPPIVDKDLAMRAIAQLDQNRREAERINKNKGKSFLRAGYIFCGYCTEGMFLHSHFTSRNGKSNHALRFVCGKHITYVNHRTPDDCAGGGKFSIRLSQVEDAVWEEILTALADPDHVPDAYEQLTRKEVHLREQRQKRIQGLNDLIDGATDRKNSYLVALGGTQDSGVRSDLLRLAEEQSASIRKWESIRGQIQAEIEQQLAENSEVRSFIRHVNSWMASMLNPSIAEKRRMAQRLGIKVYCYRHEHHPWFEMISNLPGLNATWHMQKQGRLPGLPVKDAEPNHTSVVRSEMLDKWVLSDTHIHAALPATSRSGRPTENASVGQPPWLDPDERERVRVLAERYR